MLGKGLQRKWCSPAAMEPIASCTSDSVDYWHYTHSKSTCWKGAWQLHLFTHQSCYACILQCPQAPSGVTLYALQENSSVKQWQNLSFSTISHILFCMLESFEPWGNTFVSCLDWGVWCSVSVTLHLLNALLLMCFSDRYLSTLFFFLLITSTGHLEGDGWGEREIVDMLEI